jgi:ribosomal protein S18 acetylase RimI-like enzyme
MRAGCCAFADNLYFYDAPERPGAAPWKLSGDTRAVTSAIVRLLTRQECLDAQDAIAGVYGAAFAQPPYRRNESDVRAFQRSFVTHLDQQDFRLVGAFDPTTEALLGFAYGRTAAPGQWWHDVVIGPLTVAGLDDWLVDSLNLVELAVKPAAQGLGIGSALHDALLAHATHYRAVLSTQDCETQAMKLYRRRSWQILLTNFMFPAVEAPYRIMGKLL